MATVSRLLLLVAGDIESNPGPAQQNDPCPVCFKPVRQNTNFFSCLDCGINAHRKCSATSWICPTCAASILPFSNVDLDASNISNISNIPDLADDILSLPSGFAFFHLNICGLQGKIDHIRSLLANKSIPVFCFSESHMDPTKAHSVDIDGYVSYHKPRQNGRGGGVSVYVRSDLPSSEHVELSSLPSGICDHLWISLNFPNCNPRLVGCVYLPPSAKIEDRRLLETVVQAAVSKGSEVMIAGDFNIDLSNNDDARRARFLTEACSLSQLIEEPTRVQHRINGSSSTIIDHVYTSHPQHIVKSGVLLCSLSDHDIVYSIRKHNAATRRGGTPTVISYRSYRNFDDFAFQEDLVASGIDTTPMAGDTDACWTAWCSIFIAALNRHAPIRRSRVSSKSPAWLNGDVLEAIRLRDLHHRRWRRSKLDVDHTSFKKARNSARHAVRNARASFHNKIIQDSLNSSSKKAWKEIKSLLPKKPSIAPTVLTVDGVNISSASDIATKFNEHFSNVCRPVNGPPIPPPVNSLSRFVMPPCQPEFVYAQINAMPTDKSIGLDQISARTLKAAGPVIAASLSAIFNMSLSTGVYPSAFKIAKVAALHKSGLASNPSNYRPISILSIPSKILERHVASSMTSYLEQHNLIYRRQSGFRPRHSTATACVDIFDHLLSACNDGDLVGSLLIDFSKAFDRVHHDVLLTKLASLGIHHTWFQSYLTGRSQRVVFSGKTSPPLSLLAGVPQGSVLGPLFFCILINDLPSQMPTGSTSFLYADDGTLCVRARLVPDLEKKLQEVADAVHQWSVVNRMAPQPHKSKNKSKPVKGQLNASPKDSPRNKMASPKAGKGVGPSPSSKMSPSPSSKMAPSPSSKMAPSPSSKISPKASTPPQQTSKVQASSQGPASPKALPQNQSLSKASQQSQSMSKASQQNQSMNASAKASQQNQSMNASAKASQQNESMMSQLSQQNQSMSRASMQSQLTSSVSQHQDPQSLSKLLQAPGQPPPSEPQYVGILIVSSESNSFFVKKFDGKESAKHPLVVNHPRAVQFDRGSVLIVTGRERDVKLLKLVDAMPQALTDAAPMLQEHKQGAVALLNGDAYVGGHWSGVDDTTRRWFERYSRKENKWEKLADTNNGRWRHALVTANGYIHAIGGFRDADDTIEMYDHTKNAWEVAGKWYFSGNCKATFIDDKIWLFNNTTKDMWTFSVPIKTINLLPDNRFHYVHCIFKHLGMIHVVGQQLDEEDMPKPCSNLYAFNPNANEWIEIMPIYEGDGCYLPIFS